jgi:hypothetical protein
MAETAPTTPAGDDRNLIKIDDNYLALSFEDRLAIFWEKNSRAVLTVLAVLILAIVGKGAFDYFAAQRNKAIIAEYAAATGTAQLQAFTATYPTLPLSGLAHLRLADESYAAGDYSAAHTDYTAAVKLLGADPLASRARLGSAMSLLQAKDATASSALQAIANDTKLPRALRAESAFHLAELSRDAGQTAEATRWTDLVISNEATGFWGQRAAQLRDTLPLPAANAAPTTAPAK